ncbi:hypothetical protein GOP47_0031225, partial [Adiantum capillus-veneris]
DVQANPWKHIPPSTSSFILPLYHRDDPTSPLRQGRTSREEEIGRGRVASRMLRDMARVEGISKRVGATLKGHGKMATKGGHTRADATGRQNVSAPVNSDSGEFFTTMR